MTELTLANLGGGALMECVSAELRRICENIQDPNVRAEAKRKLKIEITIEPEENRQASRITYAVQALIPGPDAGKSLAVIGIDPQTRKLNLFEVETQPNLYDAIDEVVTVSELKRA